MILFILSIRLICRTHSPNRANTVFDKSIIGGFGSFHLENGLPIMLSLGSRLHCWLREIAQDSLHYGILMCSQSGKDT